MKEDLGPLCSKQEQFSAINPEMENMQDSAVAAPATTKWGGTCTARGEFFEPRPFYSESALFLTDDCSHLM